MAISGAFGDAVAEGDFLDDHPMHEGYWKRFANFLTRTETQGCISQYRDSRRAWFRCRVRQYQGQPEERYPTFKKRLQEHMAGHLGALVNDVPWLFRVVRQCSQEASWG